MEEQTNLDQNQQKEENSILNNEEETKATQVDQNSTILQKINCFSSFQSLNSISSQKDFWKPTKDDFLVWEIQIGITVLIWLVSFLNQSYISYLCFWDGPNYVYAARTWYDMPNNNSNLWFRFFDYNASYFACHLPGYPLVIRIFSILCFNEYLIGDILSIIFCSLLFPYVFRRFLIIYDLVVDPSWTVILSLFLPLRFAIYKLVGASEPLYMSYCYLALIFFKTDNLIGMLLAMWGACITRIEGLAIVGTIGLCYLLKFDILRAIFTSLGFLGSGSLLLFHKIKFDNYMAYFQFNQAQQGLIQFPFFYLFAVGRWTDIYPIMYNLLLLETTILAGICVFLRKCIPIAIFSIVYFLYISLLFHVDIWRYSLPAYVPCLLAAFDPIFSHRRFKALIIFLLPAYAFVLAVYATGMFNSNRCWDDFFLNICDPVRWPMPD